MTALVIFFSIIAAIIYSTISGTTWIGPGTLTVYVWALIAGLATASFFAFRSWFQPRRLDDGAKSYTRSVPSVAEVHRVDVASPPSGRWRLPIGALILVANFAGSHIAWNTSDPTLVSAILDTATASYFILGGQTRWELVIGFLFLGSVGLALLTFLDVLPDHTERASEFIALSFPDLSSILGHLANAILGFGAGDAGYRLRNLFRVRPRLAVARAHLLVLTRRAIREVAGRGLYRRH